jgi:D-glycero-alpha-D-manno-heptose-7-phosphate kinase
MPHLLARAPTRIDFGGGWTDVPPYSDEQGGCVCNVAIARWSVVRLAPRDDTTGGSGSETQEEGLALVRAALRRAELPEVRLDLTSDFPLGAGLGGSSAAGVAVSGALAAWRGQPLDRHSLAETSRRLEVEDLGVAGGRQDHYAAAFGGALGLWFTDQTRVRRIGMAPHTRAALERRCIVVYTGQSRVSGETIMTVLNAYRARDPKVLQALASMKRLAEEMITALEAGDVDALGALVGEHWQHQRSLHPAIPTRLIDAILERASAAGALGGKALGASGGGCVVVIAPDQEVERVRSVVESLAQPLRFEVDETGFRCETSP